MADLVLKSADLSLKTCLETFKKSPFSVETFFEARSECLKSVLLEHKNDYAKIIAIVIREVFTNSLRQANTLFSNKENIYNFINRELFPIAMELRFILKESDSFDRTQLIQMWYSSILAGEGLKPYSADFSLLLDDLFTDKVFKLISKDFDERFSCFPLAAQLDDCEIVHGKSFDLNTTIALNAVIDLINHSRLCPPSEKFTKLILDKLESNDKLTKSMKSYAVSNLQ
jgi:hypothetical protein